MREIGSASKFTRAREPGGITRALQIGVERLCIWAGCFGLLAVSAVYLDAWIGSRQALAAFAELPPATAGLQPVQLTPADAHTTSVESPDYSEGQLVALLRIPRLELEVPVFFGTARRTLNHGAGIVTGTALPGSGGNTVISAHRDSFFRPLQGIEKGDRIELVTQDGSTQEFQVDNIFITDPLDVSVLEPSAGFALTLITCHPFQYVGFAPDRFIVRAGLMPYTES